MIRNSAILCSWLALCAVGLPRQASALKAADGADFADYSLRNASNQVLLPGRLFTPPEAQLPGAEPRPLIINLAGSVGNGTDNIQQLGFISDVMMIEARDRGVFIYAPQAVNSWSTTTITSQVMTMVDRAISTLNVDTHRIYLTGYSQGSTGTWTMLSRYDGRFAAAVPISGAFPASDFVASRLVDTPIFAFHARDDATTSVVGTRNILNSILTADGQALPTYLPANDSRNFLISNSNLPFHQALSAEAHQVASISDFFITDPRMDLLYYETATGGHDSMLGVLNFPEIYDWMFLHTTAVPEPSAYVLFLIGGTVVTTIDSRKRARKANHARRKEYVTIGVG